MITVLPTLRQLAAELGEALGVPRVQSDRRLVEHVEGAHQLRPQLIGEIDALGFPAGQRPRLPTEGEVAEPDPLEEGELGAQELERFASHRFFHGENDSSPRKVLRSSTVLPFQSAMVAPPTVTLSASGLSRAPLQRGHGHWLR